MQVQAEIDEAVSRLREVQLGLAAFLVIPRARAAKLALLDAAISQRAGTAITAVVRALEQTLSPSIFARELRIASRRLAVMHWVQYLKQRRKHGDLVQLYGNFLCIAFTYIHSSPCNSLDKVCSPELGLQSRYSRMARSEHPNSS